MKAKKEKYYVIFRGSNCGVHYGYWTEFRPYVENYHHARYKSYEGRAEAHQAWQDFLKDPSSIDPKPKKKAKPIF